MGGHHKKNLRAEKAKVKLKGAKLPKGLNVTKTEFKVRKVVIREQLKEYDEGERHVNMKESLTRLKHPSSGFRAEALRTLRDAISAGHSGILGQLGELVQGVAAICFDVDKDTRRESFKTMSALLAALPADAIAPFFHIISSYLRCAMTHIQPALQEDALLLLDVLLQHVPRLVAANSAKIFQNFLEMISRVRAEGDRASRTLTVHMGQKQTTIKWRSKVLLRLQQMLQTLSEHNRRNGILAAGSSSQIYYTFSVKEPQHFLLKRVYATQHGCDLSALFARSVGDSATISCTAVGTNADESTLLRGYVTHLLPLLMDAWLEVRPQVTDGTFVILSADAALTLKIVLEIIENLWTLVELHETQVNNHDMSDWFQQEYADAFSNNFLQIGFPYQQAPDTVTTISSKKSKKYVPSSGGQFCLQQNITLAQLMSRFFTQQRIKKQSSKFIGLLQYLNTIVSNLNVQTLENYRNLELALRAQLYLNGMELLQLDAKETRQLLRSTIKAFLHNQIPSKDGISGKVLVLLCDIVQSPQLFNSYGAKEFVGFLEYLPQLLLKPTVSEATLVSMSNLGKQNHHIFLKALVKLTAEIIANIQKMQVTGASNAFEGKKHIMNLFYWAERGLWNSTEQAELLQQVEMQVTDKRIVSYYKSILAQLFV